MSAGDKVYFDYQVTYPARPSAPGPAPPRPAPPRPAPHPTSPDTPCNTLQPCTPLSTRPGPRCQAFAGGDWFEVAIGLYDDMNHLEQCKVRK